MNIKIKIIKIKIKIVEKNLKNLFINVKRINSVFVKILMKRNIIFFNG